MITFISVSRHSIEKSRIKHLSKHSQTFESNETINILSLGTFTLKVEGEILKNQIFFTISFPFDIVIQNFISFSTLGKFITRGLNQNVLICNHVCD